jgi:hypothetical protein
MTRHMYTFLGIAVGAALALLLAYLGMVVFVLVTIGIPLGSQPRPMTAAEYVVLLGIGIGAAALGGHAAARVARDSHSPAVWGVCAVLAVVMVWGFSGRNAWPDWWGPASGAVMAIGARIGGSLRSLKRTR